MRAPGAGVINGEAAGSHPRPPGADPSVLPRGGGTRLRPLPPRGDPVLQTVTPPTRGAAPGGHCGARAGARCAHWDVGIGIHPETTVRMFSWNTQVCVMLSSTAGGVKSDPCLPVSETFSLECFDLNLLWHI